MQPAAKFLHRNEDLAANSSTQETVHSVEWLTENIISNTGVTITLGTRQSKETRIML